MRGTIMSLESYKEAAKLIEQYPKVKDFVGHREESLIKAAEKKLGLKFPTTYRLFLAEYGAGNFGSSEIYGVIADNFEESSVPDAVWRTLVERREGDLPPNLIAIYDDGMGNLFCIDYNVQSKDESPIVAFYLGFPPAQQPREIIATDFGEFLLNLVQREISQLYTIQPITE